VRVSKRPRATSLVRAQAAAGEGHVAIARHRVLTLDPLSAHLLRLMDGTRDRSALIEAMRREIHAEPAIAPRLASPSQDPNTLETAISESLDRLLRLFARNGLLQS
jgi:methyltransferase-like protein